MAKKWAYLFRGLFALGVAADLVLALGFAAETISERVWDGCAAHPALVAGGVLGTVAVCRLLRHDWRDVLLAALLGGHLFTHG